jgi:hypothetical protein
VSMLAATKLFPVADGSTLTLAMLCDPLEPLETFPKSAHPFTSNKWV